MFRNSFQSGVVSVLSAHGSDPLQLWDVCSDHQSEGGRSCRIRRANSVHDTHPEGSDSACNVAGPIVEVSGARLSQNCIICPPMPALSTARPSLGITLPYLYLTVHVPAHSEFSFEVTILDDMQTVRRFRASTYQSTTVIQPDICMLPLRLERQRWRPTRDAVLLPAKKQRTHTDYGAHDNDDYYGLGNDEGEDEEDIDEKVTCWNRVCVPLAEYTRKAYGMRYSETMWIQVHANCRLKRIYFAEKEMDEDDELPEEFRLYHCPQPS